MNRRILSLFLLLSVSLLATLSKSCATQHAQGDTSPEASSSRSRRSRGARTVAAAILIEESAPERQSVFWARYPDGAIKTHWLSGNRYGATVLGSTDGIVLPDGGNVIEITTRHARIPLCSCAEDNPGSFEGSCIPANSFADVHWPEAVNRMQDEPPAIPLVALPFDPDKQTSLQEISFQADVLATFGPLALIGIRGHIRTCDDATNLKNLDNFLLVRFATGELVPFFSDAEIEQATKNEQQEAFRHINRNGGFPRSPLDLSLRAIQPLYLQGLGFALNYEYASDVMSVTDNGHWSASRSVVVAATFIPAVLIPWILAPEPMALIAVPPKASIGGWALPPESGESLIFLFQTVTGLTSPAAGDAP